MRTRLITSHLTTNSLMMMMTVIMVLHIYTQSNILWHIIYFLVGVEISCFRRKIALSDLAHAWTNPSHSCSKTRKSALRNIIGLANLLYGIRNIWRTSIYKEERGENFRQIAARDWRTYWRCKSAPFPISLKRLCSWYWQCQKIYMQKCNFIFLRRRFASWKLSFRNIQFMAGFAMQCSTQSLRKLWNYMYYISRHNPLFGWYSENINCVLLLLVIQCSHE